MSKVYQLKKARWMAYQIVYQYEYLGYLPKSVAYLVDNNELSQEQVDWLQAITNSYIKNFKKIDRLISQNIKGWSFNLANPVLKAVLRVAIVELFYTDNVNNKIIINEAVEFLKHYANLKIAKMANAILDKAWLNFNTIKELEEHSEF